MKNKKLLFLIPFLFLSFFQIVNAQEESQVIEDNQIVQSIERILFVEVRGSQRIEPDTIPVSYTHLTLPTILLV